VFDACFQRVGRQFVPQSALSSRVGCSPLPLSFPGSSLAFLALDTAARLLHAGSDRPGEEAGPPATAGSVTFCPVLTSSFVSPPQHASLERGNRADGAAPRTDDTWSCFTPQLPPAEPRGAVGVLSVQGEERRTRMASLAAC